jgi:hypothetical protein
MSRYHRCRQGAVPTHGAPARLCGCERHACLEHARHVCPGRAPGPAPPVSPRAPIAGCSPLAGTGWRPDRRAPAGRAGSATAAWHCESGTKEPMGVDECASRECQACERHQAVCEVGGEVHCSGHLRRADVSRWRLCEPHWATCVMERDGAGWRATKWCRARAAAYGAPRALRDARKWR